MKVIIDGDIIDLALVYRISKVKTHKGQDDPTIYGYRFYIWFLNQKDPLTISRNIFGTGYDHNKERRNRNLGTCQHDVEEMHRNLIDLWAQTPKAMPDLTVKTKLELNTGPMKKHNVNDDKTSLFDQLKNYLNSQRECTYLTRKELLTYFYGPDVNFGRETVIDHYRKSLCLGGYIEQTDTKGVYIVNLKRIPDTLTLSALNKSVYNLRAR
jgi:hypothetical protein